MNRPTILLAALLLPAQALAWNHLEHVWLYDDMPVEYQVTPLDGYSGFTADELVQIQVRGFQAWRDGAPCADFRSELTAVNTPPDEDPNVDGSNNNGFKVDGVNRITFDDPRSDLAEASTLAANLTQPKRGTGRVVNGTFYEAAAESDIVYNDFIDFASDEDIAGGNCNGRISIQATAVHEIGHLMGMAHSCERGELCTDAVKRSATMFWTTDGCDVQQSQIGEDDIAGINALYGPFANFRCSNELDPGADGTLAFGVVPFAVQCGVVTDTKNQIVSASWSWGDGASSEGIDGDHTYTEPGNYTINACFEGENDSCGAWEYCFKRSSYVRACGLAEPVFTAEPFEGLAYTFRNDTDISVYGCVYDVQWDVFAGDDVSGEPVATLTSWEPVFEFPDSGRYTVVLNVGGPAGTSAAKLSFDAVNTGARGNGGCSTVPMAPAFGLLGFAAFGVLARRRRA